MAFVYEAEARARISGFEPKSILAFLETVPEKHRIDAFAGLRPIAGFRRDEPRELKERIKKLAGNISASHANSQRATDREWDILGHIWAALCFSKYEEGIRSAIVKYRKEKCTFDVFLKNAIEEADGLDVSREDVVELFQFSPFPSLDAAGSILNDILPKKELVKKAALAKLPSEFSALQERVEALSLSVAEQSGMSNTDAGGELTRCQAELQGLTKKAVELEKRCLLLEETALTRYKTLSQAIEIGNHGTDAMTKKVATYEVRTLAVEKSNLEALASLRKIEGILKPLQRAVAEHDKGRDLRKSEPELQQGYHMTLVGVEPKVTLGEGNIKKLEGAEALFRALHSNYLAIGVAESSARRLAIAVTGASMAGQLVQFSGSLSDIVAEATLCATNAGANIGWNVPAGLCDGDLTTSVLRLVAEAKSTPPSLLLRGVNKSAFEVFGYEIKRIFINRRMGVGEQYPGMFIYATWIDGDSTLSDRSTLAELGPLVNTDTLSWVKAKGALGRYQITLNTMDVSKHTVSDECDLTEISSQIAELPLVQSELWRRTVRSLTTNIVHVPGVTLADACDCVLLYWVVPWLATTNMNSLDLGEFVNEHFTGMLDNPLITTVVKKFALAQA